ncbi:MAG: SRPBCC domain-containing protein [Melioribacteraceae bacterium]|nr:SRPBCC domain-containing protein [Melioribacteraceae bacterium]
MNERKLYFEFTVNAAAEDAYNAWATNKGVQTFFAPGSDVNAELFGKYHIYFFPEAPEGQRGSENNVVLSHEPGKMFSFTWDSPPSLPTIRNHQRTVVLIRFQQLDENSTRVKFLQTGWGDGEEWDKCYEYFEKAWGTIVLARFRYRFENGPVDWKNLPNFSEFAVENLSSK